MYPPPAKIEKCLLEALILSARHVDGSHGRVRQFEKHILFVEVPHILQIYPIPGIARNEALRLIDEPQPLLRLFGGGVGLGFGMNHRAVFEIFQIQYFIGFDMGHPVFFFHNNVFADFTVNGQRLFEIAIEPFVVYGLVKIAEDMDFESIVQILFMRSNNKNNYIVVALLQGVR